MRLRPELEVLSLASNPFGDEGLAALVAPPAAAAGALPKLQTLDLRSTRVTDAGCAGLAATLDSGALPALESLYLVQITASAAAQVAVQEALERSVRVRTRTDHFSRLRRITSAFLTALDAVLVGVLFAFSAVAPKPDSELLRVLRHLLGPLVLAARGEVALVLSLALLRLCAEVARPGAWQYYLSQALRFCP